MLTRIGAKSTARLRVAASSAPLLMATNVQSFFGFRRTEPGDQLNLTSENL